MGFRKPRKVLWDLLKGLMVKWDFWMWICWNVFSEMEDGIIEKIVVIYMESEDPRKHSQLSEVNNWKVETVQYTFDNWDCMVEHILSQ